MWKRHIRNVSYGNLELRILAHFSEEPSFIDAFLKGQDIHSRTAVEFLGVDLPVERVKKEAPEDRQNAKIVNFAIPYGTTAPTLAKQLPRGTTEKQAQEKLDGYFKKHKHISKWIRETKKTAHRQGYTETILAKKRRVHKDIHDKRYWIVQSAERQSVNAVIQGSAADIIKIAQIKIENDKLLAKWGVEQRMQIHDELIFVLPKKYKEKMKKRVSYIMTHPFGPNEEDNLIVPLEATPDFGRSWSEAK